MIFNWTAATDEGHEFGSTTTAEPDGDDYRPVFTAARECAAEYAVGAGWPVGNVTVTAISWTS